MYNVPHGNARQVGRMLILDSITAMMVVVTIILWVLIEDRRWYGIDSTMLGGSQRAVYNEWHRLKYLELGLSLAFLGYTVSKRRVVTLLQRLCMVLPIILVWIYWLLVE